MNDKLKFVDLKRKNTLKPQHRQLSKNNKTNDNSEDDDDDEEAKIVSWKPVYTDGFVQFIQNMIQLYQEQYNVYKTNTISVQLFLLTPCGLVYRMRSIYFKAKNYRLPFGFGIQYGNRIVLATLMYANSNNLTSTNTFLQHKSLTTTKKYIRADVINLRKRFNQTILN